MGQKAIHFFAILALFLSGIDVSLPAKSGRISGEKQVWERQENDLGRSTPRRKKYPSPPRSGRRGAKRECSEGPGQNLLHGDPLGNGLFIVRPTGVHVVGGDEVPVAQNLHLFDPLQGVAGVGREGDGKAPGAAVLVVVLIHIHRLGVGVLVSGGSSVFLSSAKVRCRSV